MNENLIKDTVVVLGVVIGYAVSRPVITSYFEKKYETFMRHLDEVHDVNMDQMKK